MNEKTKTTLQWIWGCVIAALFVAFIFWLGRQTGKLTSDSKNSNNSKEVQVLIKDTVETQKWKAAYKLENMYYVMYRHQAEKREKELIKKLKQNEINKKRVLSVSDSLSFYINDSLRARYYEMFVKETD